jgi:hypothetical protein
LLIGKIVGDNFFETLHRAPAAKSAVFARAAQACRGT